ncbi:glucuronate isomerase [Paenibacillus allorhizosphaerae]|uniref:Glucuronate isomerase n=1 Tax=Paenibacillus allorhizosphaerae TaxID=2849866 RepID=A0ABN7TCW7_9BACL|nr:glucuronate isomerase [Paenibacillus allorhizosphaerae]CAG7617125.1 hypothetical protein PAECIP111802_00369 [Paenibacillus allorhizosphaerae]
MPNQTKDAFMEEIMQMNVLDTHTHLVGDKLRATDFWQIAHYFWLNRELQTGGYPADADKLPEQQRITAFLSAYHATRNTLMNWVFTQIFKQLYGIEIRDEQSVKAADAAVRASASNPGWAQTVADKLAIRRFVVNIHEHAAFEGMRDPGILIPRIDGKLNTWVKTVFESDERNMAYERAKSELTELLQSFKNDGCPGVMTTLPAYEARADRDYHLSEVTEKSQIMMMLLHELCAGAQKNGLFVQFFLGVERSWCGEPVPVNDTERILKLTALFERYAIPFELVVASELNNLDVVQAAWNFPNVHVGGLWWFNFRGSTYRDVMQYRLEAISPIKSSLIASDARCIEWSYGKILLVKKLLAEFLFERIESGWVDKETALFAAREWLYGSAAKRYGILGD